MELQHLRVRVRKNRFSPAELDQFYEERILDVDEPAGFLRLIGILDAFKGRVLEYCLVAPNAAARAIRLQEAEDRIKDCGGTLVAFGSASCDDDSECGPREVCDGGVCTGWGR